MVLYTSYTKLQQGLIMVTIKLTKNEIEFLCDAIAKCPESYYQENKKTIDEIQEKVVKIKNERDWSFHEKYIGSDGKAHPDNFPNWVCAKDLEAPFAQIANLGKLK